jgi:hypothetical protein
MQQLLRYQKERQQKKHQEKEIEKFICGKTVWQHVYVFAYN